MNLPRDPYSLNEYFIKPTDEKGHGPKLNCRVPPDLARLVEVLVASKKFPYETSSDFMRDAVWRLCGVLVPQVDSHESATIFAKLRTIQNTLESYKAGEDLIRVIESLGLRLVGLDSKSERKKLVDITRYDMEKVSDPYWRGRALRVLKERFGEYLED